MWKWPPSCQARYWLTMLACAGKAATARTSLRHRSRCILDLKRRRERLTANSSPEARWRTQNTSLVAVLPIRRRNSKWLWYWNRSGLITLWLRFASVTSSTWGVSWEGGEKGLRRRRRLAKMGLAPVPLMLMFSNPAASEQHLRPHCADHHRTAASLQENTTIPHKIGPLCMHRLTLDSVSEFWRWPMCPALLLVRRWLPGDTGGRNQGEAPASTGFRGVSVLMSLSVRLGELSMPKRSEPMVDWTPSTSHSCWFSIIQHSRAAGRLCCRVEG